MSSFWETPRKTAFRKWMFQIHFYAGLIAGLLWTVVGITGSAIVFVPELRRLEVPGWTRVEPTARPLPLETLIQRFQKERPTDRMHSIYFDFKADWGLNIRTVATNGDRIHSFVDQYRGTLLGSVDYNHRALQWIYDLHSDLQFHTKGLTANAWFAFGLMLASSTGLLLWWRGRRYWKLGLEYRTKASWKRQVWDMHNLGGFLFYLPLLLLSLSGAYYAYEPAFTKVAARLTGGPAEIPPPKATQQGASRRSLDEIQAAGLAVIPDSAPSMIIFPAKKGDAFTLRLRRPSDPHRIGLNWVYIDPSTAKVLRVDRFDQQPRGVQIIRLLTPLHYGTIGGYATRILWVITGLMPGLFFVTALLMWWNRTLSKKWRRARRRIPAFAAEPTAVAR
ncbi:MAG: PepSY domain-containing protein [Acidobacteriia bacterium]|nr:PepSY domain-containing protein [Terriglobia bacterium]